MNDEIRQWRKSEVLLRLELHLIRLGVPLLDKCVVVVSISVHNEGEYKSDGIVVLREDGKVEVFSAEKFIPLVVSKLHHLVNNEKGVVNQLVLTLRGKSNSTIDFLS
jgi:hypothetical protein